MIKWPLTIIVEAELRAGHSDPAVAAEPLAQVRVREAAEHLHVVVGHRVCHLGGCSDLSWRCGFADCVANWIIVDTNSPFCSDFLFHRSVSEQLAQSPLCTLAHAGL